MPLRPRNMSPVSIETDDDGGQHIHYGPWVLPVNPEFDEYSHEELEQRLTLLKQAQDAAGKQRRQRTDDWWMEWLVLGWMSLIVSLSWDEMLGILFGFGVLLLVLLQQFYAIVQGHRQSQDLHVLHDAVLNTLDALYDDVDDSLWR